MCTASRRYRARATALSAALAACVLAPATVPAQETPTRFELTPYAGYRFGGRFEDEDGATKVELGDDAGVGLIFNVRESATTQWEVIYARQDTTADTAGIGGLGPSTDVQLTYLQGGGTYEFEPRGRAQPYLVATLGGTEISPQVPGLDGDTFWSFSIGTGLALRPTQRLGLRLEARAWGTLVSSGTDLFCQSGISGAICEIEVDGRVLWQIETFAGFVWRF